jgi:hypothetical protein
MRYAQALSFQPLSGMKIVAAYKEYGGIVIQCAARKLSAFSFQLSAS